MAAMDEDYCIGTIAAAMPRPARGQSGKAAPFFESLRTECFGCALALSSKHAGKPQTVLFR